MMVCGVCPCKALHAQQKLKKDDIHVFSDAFWREGSVSWGPGPISSSSSFLRNFGLMEFIVQVMDLWQSFTSSSARLCVSSGRGGPLRTAGGFFVACSPFVEWSSFLACSRVFGLWIRLQQCWTQVTRRSCHGRRDQDLSDGAASGPRENNGHGKQW